MRLKAERSSAGQPRVRAPERLVAGLRPWVASLVARKQLGALMNREALLADCASDLPNSAIYLAKGLFPRVGAATPETAELAETAETAETPMHRVK